MKILFNCSNNIVGGAVQNAANFIKYAIIDDYIDYYFIVSKQVKELLGVWSIDSKIMESIDSPAQSKFARRRALKVESEFQPDLVYTMAGPTYIQFKSFHVMGTSDPYITHSDFSNFKYNRNFPDFLKFIIKIALKALSCRFGANYFLFQTETSRNGFCKRYRWSKDKTEIVPNAVGEEFGTLSGSVNSLDRNEIINIFCPSAYYPHKDLELVINLANLLKNNKNIKFILTIPKECSLGRFLKSNPISNITNIGPYSYAEASELYCRADIILIPSLLETFSTSYLEAIATYKPLVVADTEFSREICGHYANYYTKADYKSAYSIIIELIENGLEVNQNERAQILSRYGTQKERYDKIKEILLNLS